MTMANIASETWKSHAVSETSQMCRDLLFSKVTSSLFECALVCFVQTSCFMFEFSKLTKVCDVFMEIGPSTITPAVFSVPRVVYKGFTNCEHSGYTFVNVGNLCINEAQGEFTWYDAKTKCESEQGRLLVLTTQARIKGIKKYMRSIKKRKTLLGMTDAVTEGQWKWIDGTKLNTTLWSTISLNNYDGFYTPEKGNADCVVFSLSSDFDVHCLTKQQILCERRQLV